MHTRQKGISIIEAVISIAIFAVLATAAYETYIIVNRMGESADKRDRAVRLAEEGIEAVRSMRDSGFQSVAATSTGTRGLTIGATSTWQFLGTNDVTNGYVRSISLLNTDANTVTVSSTVDWFDRTSTSSVTLSTILTNWKRPASQALGFTADTALANTSLLNANRLLTGIYIGSTATSSGVTITSIKASWSTTSRRLQEIRSPLLNVVYYGSAVSGATTTLAIPIVLSPGSTQLMEFYYSGSVVNNSFTFVFGFSDGSNKTVTITNPPTGL